MRSLLLTTLTLMLTTNLAHAAIKSEVIEYRDGDTVCEGFLAYDDAVTGKRPGVLVVHDWLGLGDYVKERTKQVAALGYVAFAIDVYGKGVRAKDNDEAGKLATQYKNDPKLFRGRIDAGHDFLLSQKALLDPVRVAIMGYCFGGTAALEHARAGAHLSGVVSFHGGLATKDTSDTPITAKVLVLHGALDPWVPADEVAAFQSEMVRRKVDYQLISYSGAVHAFTKPAAGNDIKAGAAYNEAADQRSWEHLKLFLAEAFGLGGKPQVAPTGK